MPIRYSLFVHINLVPFFTFDYSPSFYHTFKNTRSLITLYKDPRDSGDCLKTLNRKVGHVGYLPRQKDSKIFPDLIDSFNYYANDFTTSIIKQFIADNNIMNDEEVCYT